MNPYRRPSERPFYGRYVTDDDLRDALRLLREQQDRVMNALEAPLPVTSWSAHVLRWLALT